VSSFSLRAVLSSEQSSQLGATRPRPRTSEHAHAPEIHQKFRTPSDSVSRDRPRYALPVCAQLPSHLVGVGALRSSKPVRCSDLACQQAALVEALHSPRDPAQQDARGDPNDLKQGMSVGRDGCGLRAVAVVPNCCCWRGRRGRSRPAPAHVGVSPHRIPTSRSRPCRGRSLARSGTAAMGARDLERQAGSQLHCGAVAASQLHGRSWGLWPLGRASRSCHATGIYDWYRPACLCGI